MKTLRFLSTSLLALACFAATANPVKQTVARQKAVAFMKLHGKSIVQEPLKLSGLTKSGENEPFYIFNSADKRGFVIISGSDKADAVIGYSENCGLSAGSLPSNARAWLEDYAKQIEILESGQACKEATSLGGIKSAIAPLLTTQWGQTAPYYNACPKYNGSFCATGCVATAMAQIMNYHKWPSTSTALPAYTTNTKGIKVAAKAATVFDWNNMKDFYNGSETDATATAVAKLMAYCGQSVQMDYAPDGSGAPEIDVPNALVYNFSYDEHTHAVLRQAYSISAWDDLIYQELVNERPVLYSGTSFGGGHAFVCDGYDGNGLYHINWGWDGISDGYFRLALLDPDEQGVGGSTTNDGFCFYQTAIIGIQPPVTNYNGAPMALTGEDMEIVGSSSVEVGIYNYTGLTGTYEIGLRVEDIDVILSDPAELDLYYGWNFTFDFQKYFVDYYELPDDVYNVRFVSRKDETDPWTLVFPEPNYVECVVENGIASLILHPVVKVSAEFEYPSAYQSGQPFKFSTTLTNQSDEYNGFIYLFASKDDVKGDIQDLLCVALGQDAKEKYPLMFFPTSGGIHHIWLTTDEDGNEVIASTTVDIDDPNASQEETEEPITDISGMDNVIYVDNMEGFAGNTVPMAVNMNNLLAPNGCSFKLTLPEGMRLQTDEDGDLVYELGSRAKKMSVIYKDWEDGSYDFALTPSTSSASISGNEGTFITFNVVIPESQEAGTYRIKLTKNLIQSKDGTGVTKDNALSDVVASFEVVDYLMGDVNRDNTISPADAIMILYHYFNVDQSGFYEKAADVNADGTISPADAIEVLYMYFNASNQSNKIIRKEHTVLDPQ